MAEIIHSFDEVSLMRLMIKEFSLLVIGKLACIHMHIHGTCLLLIRMLPMSKAIT